MPTVPAVPTFATGILTTSQMNQIRDALTFALAPPKARLRQATLQSVPNNAFTAIAFETEDNDSANGHDNAVNNSRYTVQYPGWYLVSGGIGFAASATGNRAVDIRVNGSMANGSQTNVPALAGGSTTQVSLSSELVYLTVLDYVEIFGFQNTGGSLNTSVTGDQQPRMNVVWKSN